MPVVHNKYCLDDFTISITGTVNCSLIVDSGRKSLQYTTSQLHQPSGLTVSVHAARVPFTYQVGANPQRNDFHAFYEKERRTGPSGTAVSGTAPNLSNASFIPPTPDLTGAANLGKSAMFTVQLPTYTDAATATLADAEDHYDVSVIIREQGYVDTTWPASRITL